MVTMRRACAAMGIAAALIVGCKQNEAVKKYDLSVKHSELWDVPPDAPQYNNAPESGYKKPAAKETYKAGAGGGMDPGMAAMGQGMGGQRR